MLLESLLKRQDITVDVKEVIKKSITEVKATETRLRESEELIESLLKVSPESSLLLDKEGTILAINEVATQRIGKNVDELIGCCVFDLFSPEVANFRKMQINKVIRSGEPLRFNDEREGMVFNNYIHPVLDVYGKVVRLAVFGNDITEQVLVEKSLRESEEKYRNLVERASDGITIVQNSLIKYVNPSLVTMIGYTTEEIIDTPIMNYIHPDHVSIVIERYELRIAGQPVPPIYETILIKKDGTSLEVELNAGIITFQEEPADLVIVREITERKRFERALRESEERYRTLITTMSEGVWVTDRKNKTVFVNSALENMLGYSEAEILEKDGRDFLHSDSLPFFEDIINERFIKKIPTSTYELKWIRKDGTSIITRVAGTALLDEQGETIGSFGILSDITSETKAKEALQKSEERYRRLIELSPDAIILTDLEFNIIAVNHQAVNLNGVKSAADLIGRNAMGFILPEDRVKAIENAQKTLQQGRKLNLEYRLLKVDGTVFPAELNASLITDEKGDPTAFISIVRDISERKKTKEALQESKEKYQMLIEKMHEGVVLEDEEGNITFVNPRTVEMIGFPEDELLGKHWSYVVAAEEREKVEAETAKRPKGIVSSYESVAQSNDGRKIPVLVTATPILSKRGEFKGVLSVFTDITEQKRGEKNLRESEERYRSLIENARDLIFTISPEGIIASVNTSFERITGWERDEWINQPFSLIVHPEDLSLIIEGFERILEGEQPPAPELRLLTKSGDYLIFEVKGSPQIRDGKIAGMLGIARDITERYKAEEAIRESEEKYRTLVNYSLQGLLIFQGDPPQIAFTNPVIAEILGYSIEEILNFQPEQIYNLAHPDDREGYFQSYRDRLANRDFQPQPEVRFIRKDGLIIWLEAHSSRIEYMGKPAIQAAFVDITARKKAEESLRLVKLEEERYHAMLSHFVNNDLQKIINNVELISLNSESTQEMEKNVSRIIDIASSSSKTIDTVNKIFEVLQSPFDQVQKRFNLQDVVNKAILDMKPFSLNANADQESLSVMIYADKYLENVFLELFLFIIDSCEKKLDISTSTVIKGSFVPPFFRVTIFDQCSQPISEEISLRLSKKITERWEYQGHFTGLSLVSVIMQHYEGSLTIQPQDTAGNEFQLNFPSNLIQFSEDEE